MWARVAVVTGLGSLMIYSALAFLPLPRGGIVLVGAALGPLLGTASLGLAKLLQFPHRSVSAQLAAAFNFAASAIVTLMFLVQLAIKIRAPEYPPELVGVWLGLDVAWDVYLGLGTSLFALSMLRHPRFGFALGVPGLVVSVLLLVLNLYTFPTPPGDAGLVDLGPLVGLWYLAVFIQVWRSLRWIKSILDAAQ